MTNTTKTDDEAITKAPKVSEVSSSQRDKEKIFPRFSSKHEHQCMMNIDMEEIKLFDNLIFNSINLIVYSYFFIDIYM